MINYIQIKIKTEIQKTTVDVTKIQNVIFKLFYVNLKFVVKFMLDDYLYKLQIIYYSNKLNIITYFTHLKTKSTMTFKKGNLMEVYSMLYMH